jgi:hypothetical protein
MATNIAPRIEREGRHLTVAVPSILDQEVVSIDFW